MRAGRDGAPWQGGGGRRCANRLKQFRRVATRYEKLVVTFLAMVTIAAILIWL